MRIPFRSCIILCGMHYDVPLHSFNQEWCRRVKLTQGRPVPLSLLTVYCLTGRLHSASNAIQNEVRSNPVPLSTRNGAWKADSLHPACFISVE